ncbi:MAG: hypothetical protein SOZ42_04925 [Candidatus Enterosoma sp.]|nr:hypothetical protein [Bacilli bacterium]MDY3907965.1 hypothetical protein [Candidatus Enterosoma sp.]
MSKLVLITLIVVGIIVALLIALFVVVYIKTSRAKKISNNEKEVEKKANSLASEVVDTIKKENIKEVSFQGSRVSIVFLNKEQIDKERLEKLNLQYMLMNDKIIIMIGSKAEDFKNQIEELIKNS